MRKVQSTKNEEGGESENRRKWVEKKSVVSDVQSCSPAHQSGNREETLRPIEYN